MLAGWLRVRRAGAAMTVSCVAAQVQGRSGGAAAGGGAGGGGTGGGGLAEVNCSSTLPESIDDVDETQRVAQMLHRDSLVSTLSTIHRYTVGLGDIVH